MHTTNQLRNPIQRLETRLMLATSCAALLMYLFTLSPGVFPGESANLIVRTLDLAPRDLPAHPFWSLLVRLVAWLPIGPLPIRLNLLSALCAAVSVALFFRLTFRVLFEAARCIFWEWLPVLPQIQGNAQDRLLPEQASDTMLARSKESEIAASDSLTAMAAMAGATAAAIALAFCVPFWSAAVSLHFQTFDLLLLLVAGTLLEAHLASGRTSLALCAALVCGAGAAESAVFLLGTPLMIFLLIRTAIVRDELNEGCVLLVLLGGLFGAAGGVFAAKLSCIGQSAAVLTFREVALAIGRTHAQALAQALPHVGWLLLLGSTVVPGLVVLFGAKRAFAIRMQREHRLLWVLVNVLFTGMVAGCLLNLSFSPWARARLGGHLPVMLSVVVALVTGFLVTYWRLFGYTPELEDEPEEGDPMLAHANGMERLAGRVLCYLLLAVTVVTPITSFHDSDGHQGAFADQLARECLSRLSTCRWLASDGLLDAHILVQAKMQGSALAVVTLAEPLTPARQQRIWSALTSEPKDAFTLRGAPFADTSAFLAACLRALPETAAQGAVINAPGVWTEAGLIPAPSGLFYRAAPAPDRARLTADLLTEQSACCKRLDTLLAPVRSRPPYLTMYNALLRRQTSRLANDLGVTLESRQQWMEADTAYGLSLSMDEDNASAALNRYALQRRSGDPINCVAAAQRVHLLSQRFGLQASLLRLTRSYGYLRHQDAAAWTSLDAETPAVRAASGLIAADALFTQWLTLCVAPDATAVALLPVSARASLAPSARDPEAGVARDLHAAARAIAEGFLTEAEAILRRVTTHHPNALPGWSMLADALLQRGATNLVEKDVLPAMCRAGLPDNVLIQLVRAKVLSGRSPVDHAAVQTLLRSALKQQPGLSAVRADLLRLDFAHGDAAATEADATEALAAEPLDAFANYLLASVRLDAGDALRAEVFVRRSLAAHATAATRALLADVLRQRRSFVEAELEARQAVREAPDFGQAWMALGCVLFDEGRMDEATQALEKAMKLHTSSPLVSLMLVRVRQARDQTAAKNAL